MEEQTISLEELHSLGQKSKKPSRKGTAKIGKTLSGAKLAGGNPKNERVDNDFYATDPRAVKMMLEALPITGKTMLEPCVGQGHIAKTVGELLGDDIDITAVDIVDRGYPNVIVSDFLTWQTDKRFDLIITNPPYSMAQDFAQKGIELLNDDGKMLLFLKVQFLEGTKRKAFFEKYPPKYVYVFSGRMATWNNGSPIDPETGETWRTTMCHAWFVWEKGSMTEPIVRWL